MTTTPATTLPLSSSSATTSSTQRLAMPAGLNPDTLDAISELANLLNRLQTLPLPPSSSSPSRPQQQQPQQPLSHHPHTHPAKQQQQSTISTGELSLKEIPAATDALKHRFQRARLQIMSLPDLTRSVAEQEAEVAALEARMAKQRDALLRLREVGARFAAREHEDEGMGMDIERMDG